MFILMIKNFLRGKAVIFALVLVFVMGILSVMVGKRFLLNQQDIIQKTTLHQQEHINRNATFFKEDLGLLLYYLRFAVVNQPNNLAGISIGQRDVNPSVRAVTIRTLEAQKYDTELDNPSTMVMGSVDLSFVIIYLFPLLIIAFLFNLHAEEREIGTWALLTIQSSSYRYYLLKKLAVRMLPIILLFLLLMLISAVVLNLSFTYSFFVIILTSLLYLAFWTALAMLVIVFSLNSNQNAAVLLSLWIMFCVLIPAGVNNMISTLYPVPEALAAAVKQRDGYHEKWDMDRRVTMQKFYTAYPQFEKHGVPEESFSWLWYYAMQHMGDYESQQEQIAFKTRLQQRLVLTERIALFVPTIKAQLLLNDAAGTGLRNHLAFLEATDKFHERVRMYFYPLVFSNRHVDQVVWPEPSREIMREDSSPKQLLSLVLMLLLLVACTFFTFNRFKLT